MRKYFLLGVVLFNAIFYLGIYCEDDQILVPIGSILFPHGIHDWNRHDLDNLTDNSADSGSPRIRLNFNLTFFGHKFDHIYVSNNGHFYFSPLGFRWTLFNGKNFPVPEYPYLDDLPMIAPFYSRIDIDPRDDRQRVYYRTSTRIDGVWGEESVQKRDNDMLEDLENEIHKAVVGSDLFRARFGICATWRNLTYSGATHPADARDDTVNPKNTFQAIILTDENETYAVFNYDQIDWGADPNAVSPTWARIGFNRGNGTAWNAMTRFSAQPEIVNIDNSSNSDAWGRYIFRIDGLYDTIKPGGCNNDTSGEVQIFPRYAGMLGGEQINASGPCFQPSDKILCKFDDIIVEGIFEHLQRCRCVVPTMFKVGPVSLSISVKRRGELLFDFGRWNTKIMIVTPDRVDYRVTRERSDDWSRLPPPSKLTVTWDPLAFAQEKHSKINVYIYGYHEDPDEPDPEKRVEFREIREIERDQENNGEFSFSPYAVRRDEYLDRYEDYWNKTKFEVGAIAVSIAGRKNMSLWTSLMPLGWYMYWDLIDDYGDGWKYEKCSIWYKKDISYMTWRQRLAPCPCKLTQALKDVGRFIADPECDYRTKKGACLINHNAYHCVISTHGSADGGGNQCCYDEAGDLMYTQDQPDGSHAHRAHMWGTAPYGEPFKVPVLSHYVHDILPYHYCCIWSDNLMEKWYNFEYYYPCRWYLESRNTTGCDRYEPAGPAYVFGDPHFRTFNNSFYTFNGKGEFRLLECDNLHFRLHGLFEQPVNNTYGQVNATGVTAIAVKEGVGGSVVEVRANLATATWRNRLQILVDNEEILLNNSLNRWQWFTNLSIFSESHPLNFDNNNLTLLFPSGTGVQVTESHGLLNVFVSASPLFYRRTEGLFGYWDAIEENDLTVPKQGSDERHVTSKDQAIIFHDFGQYWRIESVKRSTLTHPVGRNFSRMHLTWNLRDFFPYFGQPPMPNNATFTEQEVNSYCKDETGTTNPECVYDYRSTANKLLADNTKLQRLWWEGVYEGMKPVNSCGVLPFRGDWEGAVRNPRLYMAGQRIKAGCKDGYNFWGQDNWYCNFDGDWEGEDWGREEEWPMCMTIRHTAEYALYVTVALLGGLIILAIVFICLITKNKKAAPRMNPYDQEEFSVMSKKEKERSKEEERDFSSHASSSRQAIPSVSSSVQGVENTGLDLKEQRAYTETDGL